MKGNDKQRKKEKRMTPHILFIMFPSILFFKNLVKMADSQILSNNGHEVKN